MDCPNCGRWNPEDKSICWHCLTPLPQPVTQKKRRKMTLFGIPAWIFVIIVLFLLAPLFSQCLGLFPGT
ncbi:MAG: hypothetical protein GXP37_00545 [Chloroflexi bacterium]|nr:hypothetical protein [Chloroflexota bacterium]